MQSFGLPFGTAHVFYPEAGEERCTAALLLEVDPVGLVRRGRGTAGFALAEYVNDRPYVASSFLSVAIAQGLQAARWPARARSGRSSRPPPMPLEASLPAVPARGGEDLVRRLFEPLGYRVDDRRRALDRGVALSRLAPP